MLYYIKSNNIYMGKAMELDRFKNDVKLASIKLHWVDEQHKAVAFGEREFAEVNLALIIRYCKNAEIVSEKYKTKKAR